jgi:acetyl-CoA synthetase
MLRYWDNPEATAEKFGDGWLLTGDFGRRDDAGNVYFEGRSDDLIKSGGYRIGPAEVEAALFAHPAVQRCAAIGVPDPDRGQQVVAYVVLTAGHHADASLTRDLQSRVRAQVGAHAYPRRIEYVDTLALTSTGKVNRRALRDAATPAGAVTGGAA